MANIKINKVEYSDVPRVDVPNTDGGVASFYEVSGELDVSENGSYDVTSKASVNVNVEGSGGLTWDEVVARTTEEITLNSTTSISDYSFLRNLGLKKITGAKVRNIGASSFSHCTNLSEVDFPLLTSIDKEGLYECSSLQKLNTARINSYGTLALGCTGLLTLELNEVQKIPGSLAFWCDKLQSLKITSAKGVNNLSLGERAFYHCSSLTSIDFPENIYISGAMAFYECKALERITYPGLFSDKVYQSFYNCDSLYYVDLTNASPSYIGSATFYNADSLRILIIRSTEEPWTLMATNAFTFTCISRGTGYIYVPEALLDSYKTATNWVTYADQFRALEQYTVDGTTTGELDESKI